MWQCEPFFCTCCTVGILPMSSLMGSMPASVKSSSLFMTEASPLLSLHPSHSFHNPLHHQHYDCLNWAFFFNEPNSLVFLCGNSQSPGLALHLFSAFRHCLVSLRGLMICRMIRFMCVQFCRICNPVVKAWKKESLEPFVWALLSSSLWPGFVPENDSFVQ